MWTFSYFDFRLFFGEMVHLTYGWTCLVLTIVVSSLSIAEEQNALPFPGNSNYVQARSTLLTLIRWFFWQFVHTVNLIYPLKVYNINRSTKQRNDQLCFLISFARHEILVGCAPKRYVIKKCRKSWCRERDSTRFSWTTLHYNQKMRTPHS